jgi:hypothetical protein
MAWGGEAAHVGADLGDDHLRGDPADPGDLIQPVDRWGERGDLLVDLGLQLGDVGAGLVDARQHPGQQERVVVAEVAGEGLLQLGALGAPAGPGQLRQRLGSRSPAMSAASIARPETPKMSEATTLSLIWASTRQLLHPLLLGGAHADQVGAVAGQVPQPPDLRWRHEAGAQQLPLGDLTQPDRDPAGRSWVDPVGA